MSTKLCLKIRVLIDGSHAGPCQPTTEFEDYSFNEWKPSWPMSTKLILKLCIAIIKPKLFNSIFLISDSFIHARNVAEKLKRILWSCNHSHSKKKPNSLNRAIKHMYMYNLMAMCYKFLSRALLFVKKGTDFRNFYPN